MKNLLNLWHIAIALVCLIALGVPNMPLHAQESATGSTLAGTILDPQGKTVANAVITAKNSATGAVKAIHSDANGHYTLSGLSAGTYTVEASAGGFASDVRTGVALAAGQTQQVALTLTISSLMQQITVNAGVDSIAAQTAPSGGFLEERSAQSLISSTYIQNFLSPVADYGEIVQIVPGAFTTSADGVGLGQSKTYFRGFPDGDYDIDFDGIPFYDTNSPTHHSWAFFPAQWIGGVDFDRSPGSAATTGPTPFGGSIHLLSAPLTNELDVRGTVSYGTWNTKLYEGSFNSGSFGLFGGAKKSNLFVDVHRMSSDGYQTFNYDMRNAGSLLYQYQFSPKTVLTGFSGVIQVDSNAPGISQTRCQAYGPSATGAANAYTCTGALAPFAGSGIKFLLTNNADPVNWLDYQYNTYHVPTDFEYVGLKTEFGKGWYLEVKPYTYNYDNAELFSNATPITEAATVNGSTSYNGVKIAPCNVQVAGILPCGVDKYNSYRKYGETALVTQTSKFGILRGGMWYEWARTDRHQYPSDPLNHWADQALPNFAEQFWTNSYQPYAEYEFHATKQLNVTVGTKFADYTMDILHHADDGKTVGSLCPLGQTTGCPTTATDTGSFTAWLPSLDANYRIRPDWSVYGQVATGSIVPPSNVYDYNHTPTKALPNPQIAVTPKQQRSTTYQAGTVFKGNRVTIDADAYRIRFQNSYSSVIDTTTSETVYYLQPSSITQGLEFESNLVLVHGLNLYLNATASNAYYSGSLNAGTPSAPYYQKAPSGLWVAQTPTQTEAQGLTYSNKGFDLGFFNKRIGEMRVDNKAYHNQATIEPFSTVNTYVNYTVRNHSIFDQTQIRLIANNLLDAHNLQSLTLGTKPTTTAFVGTNGTTYTDQFSATTGYATAGADTTGIMAGRSFSVSVTFGFAPKGR
jgi:iron complex outermembrane receptor protein